MPDRRTIEAARPKCPSACGTRVRFNAKSSRWVCPEHGVAPAIGKARETPAKVTA